MAPGAFARGFFVLSTTGRAIGFSPQSVVQFPYFFPKKSVFKTAVQEPITERLRKALCINGLFWVQGNVAG
jgi:hypothetical protein